MRARNVVLTVSLALTCLYGCDSGPNYKNDWPVSNAYTELRDLFYETRYTNFDEVNLDSNIRDLESALPQRYRDVDDSEDIAARTTKELEAFKAKHSSLKATWQDYDRRLASIKRQIVEPDSYTKYMLLHVDERITHRLRFLTEIGESLAHLEIQIKVYNQRYAVDRRRYVLKKSKYQEHLLKGLAANGIPDDHIYMDKDVLLYVDSARANKNTVTVCLKAYFIMPHGAGLIPRMSPDAIFAYNAREESLGSPIEVRLTPQKESNGVTVSLTYEDDSALEPGRLKLVFGRSALAKGLNDPVLREENPVSFMILYNRRKAAPPTLPEPITKNSLGKTETDFVQEIKTIACRREGDHLIVPVSLDIHGRLVEADMILDTGASMTTVPMKLYQRGNAKPLSTLRKAKFVTANRVIESYIDEIKVETSAYSKTSNIAISDYDLPLLGANYFQGNVFTVDMENECIYVHPRSR